MKTFKDVMEGLKVIGAGTATIALAGAAVGIGKIFSSLIHSVARSPNWILNCLVFRLCSHGSHCLVCSYDGLSDLIRILRFATVSSLPPKASEVT